MQGAGAMEHARLLWQRTSQVSDVPCQAWMTVCRLVEKADPTAPAPELPNGRGASRDAEASQQPVLKEGAIARLHGLQAAPELNGTEVQLQYYEATKCRWLVTVITEEEVVAPIEKWIKPFNLKP